MQSSASTSAERAHTNITPTQSPASIGTQESHSRKSTEGILNPEEILTPGPAARDVRVPESRATNARQNPDSSASHAQTNEASGSGAGGSYTAGERLLAEIRSRIAPARKTLRLETAREERPRCSIYNTQGSVCESEHSVTRAILKLTETCHARVDSICIIENIDESWIRELGDMVGIYMPPDFLVGHARDEFGFFDQYPRDAEMDDADHPSPARRAEIVDDLLYGAYVLQDQWKHYQPDGAEPDRDSKGKGRLGQLDNLQTLQTQRKDVVIRLIDALSDLKTIVDEAGFCGEGGGGTFSTSDSSTFVSLADKCKRMMQELETIDNHQTFVSQQPGHAVRTVEGETRKLRDLRARRYYNLEAVLQFERFRADVPLTEYERLCRMAATPTLPYPHFVKTKVSYIRAHKHICIILVDGPPGPKLLSDVAFRNTVTNASIALPGIARFTAGYSTIIAQSSLYAMCQSFAGHRWHTEVLCSDQQVLDDSTDESREISSHSNVRPDPGAWAACDPQSLLYLISSSLWETKLRLLDAEIGTMSYCQMPRATTAKELFEINGSLHDYRNQLNVLKRKVGVLDTRMPEGFGKYYDAIPRIRRRGRATYLFPVVHHKNILERAQDLDKLLMDSFQVLTSSVSVHESHESTRQTRRATWIAVLAFFYLPATLVTGIFGMNIKQASDGFAWWAPLLALLAVILTTASAFGAFILIRRWRKRAKAKAEKQKLSIEKSA